MATVLVSSGLQNGNYLLGLSRLSPVLPLGPNMDFWQPNGEPAPAPDGVAEPSVSVNTATLVKSPT